MLLTGWTGYHNSSEIPRCWWTGDRREHSSLVMLSPIYSEVLCFCSVSPNTDFFERTILKRDQSLCYGGCYWKNSHSKKTSSSVKLCTSLDYFTNVYKCVGKFDETLIRVSNASKSDLILHPSWFRFTLLLYSGLLSFCCVNDPWPKLQWNAYHANNSIPILLIIAWHAFRKAI